MSILSKPWRVSLQRSPNLLSFLTANEVQTRRAGSSVPYAQICMEHKERPTQTQTCKQPTANLSGSHSPLRGTPSSPRNETTLTGRSSLFSCRQHRYLALLQVHGIKLVQ